tara:strand:+ start:110 stop:577 length:468 start_codon:yes stop_codon:yes gene_type:complete
MALKKVEDNTKLVTIDKVIAGGRGIEVSGQAYWFKKAGGQVCQYPAGTLINLEYTHLKNDETNEDLFMIKELHEEQNMHDKRIDAAITGDRTGLPKEELPKFSTRSDNHAISKDDKITNMNILNRAVEFCIATGNLSDEDILERCNRFKKMLSEF